MSNRSFAYVDKIILSKKDTSDTNVQPLALRTPGIITITDDPISIENGLTLRNYTKMVIEATTHQCDYAMLADFINVFSIDGMVNAHIVTSAQQATADSRGLKGNEVLNFGNTPNGNGYAGFYYKYSEQYDNSTRKTSCLVRLTLMLEKDEADLLLATAKVNTSEVAAGIDRTRVNPGIIMSIENPIGTALFDKTDLQSYKLDLESKGGDDTIYGRPDIQALAANVEIISSRDSGWDKMRNMFNGNELASLLIHEKISPTLFTRRVFNENMIARSPEFQTTDKRYMKLTYKGEIPIIKTTFAAWTANGITTNNMIFG